MIPSTGRHDHRAAVGGRVLQAALWLSCCVVVVLWSRSAIGAGADRVAVVIEGAGAEGVRADLVAALPEGIDVMSPTENAASEISRIADALSRQKMDDRVFATGENKRRPMLIGKLRKVARAIGADALIVGTLANAGRKGPSELQLVVVVPSDDGGVLDETIALKKAGPTRARQLRHLLGAALDGLGGEARPAAENGADTPSEGVSREAGVNGLPDTGASFTDAVLIGFGGLDFGGRQFHYNQRITNANLRPYDLPQGPLLPVTPGGAISVELYPFARARLEKAPWSVARDIGVTSHVGYNFANAQVGAVSLKTAWYSWEANLRVRMHLGDRGASPVLGLEGGLGRMVFAFKGDPTVVDILPNVDYHYLRIGADGRIPVRRFALIAGAGYRHLLTRTGPTGATIVAAGRVGEHFPRAEIAGLDAHVGGALPLSKRIEARIVLHYARYWASFHSRPGDTYIAGGALEQILNADVGIAAFF